MTADEQGATVKEELGFKCTAIHLQWLLEMLSVQSTYIFTMFTFRELSADLLQMIPDNHILLAKLCAFYPGSAADINQLHRRVSKLSLSQN